MTKIVIPLFSQGASIV